VAELRRILWHLLGCPEGDVCDFNTEDCGEALLVAWSWHHSAALPERHRRLLHAQPPGQFELRPAALLPQLADGLRLVLALDHQVVSCRSLSSGRECCQSRMPLAMKPMVSSTTSTPRNARMGSTLLAFPLLVESEQRDARIVPGRGRR
jgi:hypothetical protein